MAKRGNSSSPKCLKLRPWIGLILSLTFFAISFSFFQSFTTHPFRDFETSDSLSEFWKDAGLQSHDLEEVFDSGLCQSDDIHRLGCEYSVALMALSEGLEWQDGKFVKIQSLYPQISWSEKQWIESLKEKNDDPVQQWQALLKMKPMRAETVGLGFNAYYGVTIDPHSYLFPYRAYENSFFKSTQQLVGQFTYAQDGIRLKNIFSHTAFADQGLSQNAKLEKVDGEDASSYTLSKLQEKLSSVGSKTVSLQFEKSPALKLTSSELLMEHVRSFSLRDERGELAVIEIHKFVNRTCDLVRQEIKNHAHAQGLILDLRGNPGGQVDEAVCTARLFLKGGQKIFEMKDLNGNFLEAEYSHQGGGMMTTTPIAILVDNGTASSAEIFAGSLKDLGRASLVGERTFGKGTFQDGRVWDKNAKILFFKTTGFYYFKSGWTPQIVGIQVDYRVSNSAENAAERREETAFFQPLRPFDLWSGPQTDLASNFLVHGADCDGSVANSTSDLFLQRARAALICAPKLKNRFSGQL